MSNDECRTKKRTRENFNAEAQRTRRFAEKRKRICFQCYFPFLRVSLRALRLCVENQVIARSALLAREALSFSIMWKPLAMLLSFFLAPLLAFGVGIVPMIGEPPTMPLAAQPVDAVGIGFDDTGLTSIKWHDTEFLNSSVLQLNIARMIQPDGVYVLGDLTHKTTVDAQNHAILQEFSWGAVRCVYTSEANRLYIDVTISNTSTSLLDKFILLLPQLQFPAKPAEYDGTSPLFSPNIGAPSIITASFGTGVLEVTNEDVTQPLMVALPWTLDKANTIFPLIVNTDRNTMYPNSFPLIKRQVPAGTDLHFRLALRFGPANSSVQDLAGDLYEKFAEAFPQSNQWADHRAIAMLMLGRVDGGFANNPRGFFNDPNVDVTTPAGLADFRKRLLAYADRSIAIMKAMNAQGMITWDAEGEQFPQGTTYIGDPRLVETLAPEMIGVIDQYFQKFRDAGFRVGMTIRPQQLALTPDKMQAHQLEVDDPAKLLLDKIAFAKKRWGVTIFYIDSNGDKNDPVPASVMAQIAAANPDVLLVPEMENTQYYSVTAPYNQLNQGFVSTPDKVREVYPKAFGVICINDGDLDGNHATLVNSVRQGDILLFRGWFDSLENGKVKSIYDDAGAQ